MPANLSRALAFAPAVFLAAVLLERWGRYRAGAGAFLLLGLALAVLFSGALTLTILVRFGAMDGSDARRRLVHSLLLASAVLVAVHFGTLAFRRHDFNVLLHSGRRAVAILEERRQAGVLPKTLRDAGVRDGEAEALRYNRASERDYVLCFASPGGESCYSSSEGHWRLQP